MVAVAGSLGMIKLAVCVDRSIVLLGRLMLTGVEAGRMFSSMGFCM